MGDKSATTMDWMKSNDVEYEHIKKRACDTLVIQKTGIIGGLDLREKAEHSRERDEQEMKVMDLT